jgi:Uma2 family endonuclease
MLNTSRIARDIEATEGFAVRIRVKTARTKPSYQRYVYQRIARNSFTVADWRRRRFEALYPDLAVDVLLGDGRTASPRSALSKIRASYD